MAFEKYYPGRKVSKYEEEKMNEPPKPKFLLGKFGARSLSRDDSAKELLKAVI